MMVALALTIFMMAILSEAFVVGLESFRRLKGIADLDSNLRTAANLLRRDLRANHFEGNLRVSDLFGRTGSTHPDLGFFCVGEGYNPTTRTPQASVLEGFDANNLPSFRDTDDFLHMTVRFNGNERDAFLYGQTSAANNPLDQIGFPSGRYDNLPNTYANQWGEVVYWLAPAVEPGGQQRWTGGAPGVGLPLFDLHRRALLLVPEFFSAGTAMPPRPGSVAPPNTDDVSAFGSAPNSPADVQYPQRRFGVQELPSSSNPTGRMFVWNFQPLGGPRQGADRIMTDVLSFDVKVWNGSIFVDLAGGDGSRFGGLGNNPAVGVRGTDPNAPRNLAVYDTWCQRNGPNGWNFGNWSLQANNPYVPPYPVPLQAIQITIRVWDRKTEQARQITIIQDL
jgi:hypothetical protein